MKKGKIGEQLKQALFKVLICVRVKDIKINNTTNNNSDVNDKYKRTLLIIHYDILRLIYFYFIHTDDE
jgi:hypothetical protein